MIEVYSVGGYEEVGRNCTAVAYGDEMVIFDLGFNMERVVALGDEEHVNIQQMSVQSLRDIDAIPDDSVLQGKKKKVVGIVSNHGHLDHIGAIPKMAGRYKCPIVGTPYTIELIDHLDRESKAKLQNQLLVMNAGETIELSKNLTLEFVNMTHSIPDTVLSVLHTPEGAIVYANDYKLDNFPQLGEMPDYKRIKKLGRQGVKLLIVETVRIEAERKTPSETVARAMLEDVLVGRQHENALFITTFASHIERISTILDLAGKMGRQPVMLGRSMHRYSTLAEKLGILEFPDNLQIFGRGKTIGNFLDKVKGQRDRYMFICTGHQGEPGAALSRLANRDFPYQIQPGDEFVFSSSVIPSPINQDNHYRLTSKLKNQGARIFSDVHTSGHASKEDHRDLLLMLRPENVVPCHGPLRKLATYAELCSEMNMMNEYTNREYALGQSVHLLHNGQIQEI